LGLWRGESKKKLKKGADASVRTEMKIKDHIRGAKEEGKLAKGKTFGIGLLRKR